ncbi:MAG: DEAD/DEAH box helicase family protein [Planctomycetes bacterium]|nr:DEAD/DEAH box helicase family protein [Planctomycetota bacterium]
MSAKPLQQQLIEAIARRVDAWRGFTLGHAAEPYDEEAPRYEPVADGEREVSDTTMALLQHWFRREPHIVGVEPHTAAFKYWPHQRRLVETFIYLHEVVGLRRTEDLYRFGGVEAMGPQRDPWAKLGGQLATGSGKTKMMSLIVAWSYLNSVCEPDNDLGLGRHAILIAPGLFVKDRLLQDFAPPNNGVPVFWSDPVIPPEFERLWNLKVYDPSTCPRQLDPDEGALVVTNFHQLLRTREEIEQASDVSEDRQLQILFGDPEPERLEAVKSPLLERFARSKGLLVLNDEAHHVWDEPGHAAFEEKARQKALSSESDEEREAMAWISAIRKLNGSENSPGRVGLQVDLSATLFQETGTTTQTKRGKKEGRAEVRFKENELFRHTVVTYDLAEAIRDGIVKKPILERVEVRNERTGDPLPLVQPAAPNAWKKYEHLLVTGIERWKKVRDQLREEGDLRKPILFVLCTDKGEAAEVANFLTYGEPTRDDLSGKPVKGYVAPDGGKALFVEKDDGVARSTVVQIHIGQKEESNEEDWEKVRAVVNAIDRDEVKQRDDAGNLVTVPNRFNVVVSVMMLKEGWDVRNVKVIVPLRPCGSRTLTEQALGRGLRKMHPPVIDDDGSASMSSEELYVIEHPSFKEILDQIDDLIERKSSDEIDHRPDYVAVPPLEDTEARESVDVRLVRVGETTAGAREWRRDLDVNKLPGLAPRVPWLPHIDDTEIRTWLKEALKAGEQEGQRFTLSAEPSYRDFDHVIEFAFAIPLLQELRVGYQHKTAVKDVVKEFLERKTFALPAGVPIRFDEVKDPADATIAIGNLSRPEVGGAVRGALLSPIRGAIQTSLRAANVDLMVRRASQIGGYQALKQNVVDNLKRSPFQRLAGANPEECRVAVLFEASNDVVGWVFNHRHGIAYSIPYDWQGHTAHYFPDFVVRARFGAVFHNLIVEVKGRLDDKDKAKARRGRRWCEILTENDVEPWHYLMLVENPALAREDITWWQNQSVQSIEDLVRRHEGLDLVPEPGAVRPGIQQMLATVDAEEQFKNALPVYDLAVKAGTWGSDVAPSVIGWGRLPGRELDDEMFLAKVVGHSMEPGIYDGAWGIFRSFVATGQPSPFSLDGRRVVARLPSKSDPETGAYTLKRWKVTKIGARGEALEITLRADNKALKPIVVTPKDGDLRVVAEYLDTVG